ncbi:MAG: tRNA-intron lyase [archaeon]|nr:tRNA-intron lyase [archaeon]
MSGELVKDSVYIRNQKESSQLYNKGNYGYPMKGGALELDLAEAVYLCECQRLTVTHMGEEISFENLFNYSASTIDDFDVKYMVYRDIRSRGFIVRIESGTFDMSVFPRGMTRSNSRPIYMVRAVSERMAFNISIYTEEISETENKGKELLYGVVDEEGDITYYVMSSINPIGSILPGKIPKVTGYLIKDRVFIFDLPSSEFVRNNGFYGKMIGSVLQLSLIEACYLLEKGEFMVRYPASNEEIKLDKLLAFGRHTQDEFDLRMKAYSDAKERGLVIKTGFKYGTHFRAYDESPDNCHAKYLIHAVNASSKTMWPEISRAVRLSGGVKKKFLFCEVGSTVKYVEFKWIKP